MPHEINWYDANKILLCEYHDHVSREEIDGVLGEILSALDQSSEAIQLIVDLRQSTQFDIFLPGSLPSLVQFVQHKNLDWTAVVGITTSVAFMLKLITKAYEFQYAIFDGVEEAADFLRQVRVLQKPSSDVPTTDQTNDATASN